MAISVVDDRQLNQPSTATCSVCGQWVLLWVRIEHHDGRGAGVNVCSPCMDDANEALAEREDDDAE